VWVVLAASGLVKRLEDPRELGLGDARAGILHHDLDRVAVDELTRPDGDRAAARELDCVVHEVVEDDP
jgi:hypothetical protein